MRSVVVALLLCWIGAPLAAQHPDHGRLTPRERAARMARERAASAADRAQMLRQLGIQPPDSLPPPAADPNRPPGLTQRPGSSSWYDAAGNLYRRSEWGHWSNYETARAGGDRARPDPLVRASGDRITTAPAWWIARRPEILRDVVLDLYGRIPSTPAVRFAVTRIDSTTYAGQAVVQTVTGHIDNAAYPAATPRIELTMYLPPKRAGRVPVVVRLGGFGGIGTALPDPIARTLALGWAFASVNPGAIQPDDGAGLATQGIIGLVNRGHPRKPDDWGALAAWSWGLSRVLDYLETDPAVDATRAAIQGHSRWGKAALLAGALDIRWAIVFASCSGAMGASIEKRDWGESIDDVAGTSEYHWMAGNFLRYAGHWTAMPVDAHELIALVAPRPVFISAGATDQWADPRGEFLAVLGADPVYWLLGARGLRTTTMPAPGVPLTEGALAFFEHVGGHTDAPDFPVFLQWASRYFHAPPGAP